MRGPQLIILFSALLAAACGGDGSTNGGSGAPPIVASPSEPPATASPPSDGSDLVLQYPGPQVFTVGVPGTSDVPWLNYNGGNSIRMSPQLPPGLEIDPDTGVISGTPTAVTPAASYSLSVSNEASGTSQASVVIEVNDGPFFYSSPAILAWGSAMMPLSPRGPSGAAKYTVTPPLPGGLALDTATGVISGIPISAQPATYYQVSRAEALLTLKFGLTLAVGVDSMPITVSSVSTLTCAYSGGFIGTFTGTSQANDEGLIAIALTPDGIAKARVLELSDAAVYDGEENFGPDGSFDIVLLVRSGTPTREIKGNFSGADRVSGTYQVGDVAKPFIASRLGGSPDASVRFTGGFGSSNSYRIDFGVLDETGTAGVGTGFQFEAVGSDYRLINRQLAIQGTFEPNNTFAWSIPDDAVSGVDTKSADGLTLNFGDPYDGLFFAKTLGCRLN